MQRIFGGSFERVGLILLGAAAAVTAVTVPAEWAGADTTYPPPIIASTSCSVSEVVPVGHTFTFQVSCTFAPGTQITVTLNGNFYETLTAPASGVLTETIVVTDPHISMNGGAAVPAAFNAAQTFVATGVNSAGGSNTATTIITIPETAAAAANSGLAFTGADIAATVGAGLALLVMGSVITLYARRRASRSIRSRTLPAT